LSWVGSKSIDFHFLSGVVDVVVVILIVSALLRCISSHLQLSSFIWNAVDGGTVDWFSGDVFWIGTVSLIVFFAFLLLLLSVMIAVVVVYCCYVIHCFYCIQPWDCFRLFAN
jgi:hypothetical protein